MRIGRADGDVIRGIAADRDQLILEEAEFTVLDAPVIAFQRKDEVDVVERVASDIHRDGICRAAVRLFIILDLNVDGIGMVVEIGSGNVLCLEGIAGLIILLEFRGQLSRRPVIARAVGAAGAHPLEIDKILRVLLVVDIDDDFVGGDIVGVPRIGAAVFHPCGAGLRDIIAAHIIVVTEAGDKRLIGHCFFCSDRLVGTAFDLIVQAVIIIAVRAARFDVQAVVIIALRHPRLGARARGVVRIDKAVARRQLRVIIRRIIDVKILIGRVVGFVGSRIFILCDLARESVRCLPDHIPVVVQNLLDDLDRDVGVHRGEGDLHAALGHSQVKGQPLAHAVGIFNRRDGLIGHILIQRCLIAVNRDDIVMIHSELGVNRIIGRVRQVVNEVGIIERRNRRVIAAERDGDLLVALILIIHHAVKVRVGDSIGTGHGARDPAGDGRQGLCVLVCVRAGDGRVDNPLERTVLILFRGRVGVGIVEVDIERSGGGIVIAIVLCRRHIDHAVHSSERHLDVIAVLVLIGQHREAELADGRAVAELIVSAVGDLIGAVGADIIIRRAVGTAV